MKKRFLAVLLTASLVIGGLAGCGASGEPAKSGGTAKETAEQKDTSGSGDETKEVSEEDLPVIRVAVQPYFLSSEIGYMIDNGIDVKNGFKIKPVLFSSGAPINEALSTDSFDIAPTGGAYLFGVANFNAKLIGSHVDGTGGNEVWIKKDSDMAKVMGANSEYPEILGSAETVKGKTILQTTGTTAQYAVVKWLDAIGAKTDDVKMVHMEFAQVFNAFKSNQGDAAALVSPYCFQTDDTMVKAADLKQLGIQLYEEIIIPDRVYQDDSMKPLISKFLKALYSVGDEFEADSQKKFDAVYKWYQDNGSTASQDDVQRECLLKKFVTTEQAKTMTLGEAETAYAEFMVSQDKLDEKGLETFKKNIINDYLKEALQ